MNYNCSIFLDLRNLQEQVKKAFCYQKLFWPFTVWINCSSDLKNFANSWPSASNFKSFSRSLEQFFLTVGQNNFGNKIPFLGRMDFKSFKLQYHIVLFTANKIWIFKTGHIYALTITRPHIINLNYHRPYLHHSNLPFFLYLCAFDWYPFMSRMFFKSHLAKYAVYIQKQVSMLLQVGLNHARTRSIFIIFNPINLH